MEATLAALRANGASPALEDSQTAWNQSVDKDVALAMDVYAGGSLAGTVGAYVRAHATAQRAQYLEEYRRLVQGE